MAWRCVGLAARGCRPALPGLRGASFRKSSRPPAAAGLCLLRVRSLRRPAPRPPPLDESLRRRSRASSAASCRWQMRRMLSSDGDGGGRMSGRRNGAAAGAARGAVGSVSDGLDRHESRAMSMAGAKGRTKVILCLEAVQGFLSSLLSLSLPAAVQPPSACSNSKCGLQNCCGCAMPVA